MNKRTRQAAAASLGVVTITLVAGCAPVRSAKADCTEASPTMVRSIMSGAIEDGRPTPSATYIDHIEDDGGYVERLPAQEQRFGATQVLGLKVTFYFGGPDASDSIPGVIGSALFYLDNEDQVVGPVYPIHGPTFGVPTPDDPDWKTWARQTFKSSKAVFDILGCVKP